jgi:hypothetical protein
VTGSAAPQSFRQVIIVLGVWLGAAIASSADVNDATSPIALVAVVTVALLLHATTSH